MLSEKPWKLDAALLLLGGLLCSLFFGMAGGLLLLKLVPKLTADDRQFYGFIISGVSFQGVALWLTHQFLRTHEMTWRDFLGLNSPALRRVVGLALGVGVFALPLALGLNKLSELLIQALHMTAVEQPSMRILEVSVGPARRACFAVAAIVLAPVVEEILFRGLLYPLIKQRGHPRAALWVSALLFALIHANLMTFVPLAFFALALTWLYEKTDALIAPIVTHSFFNAVNFLLFIYHQELRDWLEHLQPPT